VTKMCMGGSTPKDNSAESALAEEAARQEKIKQGTSAIDSAFTGFNDDFYNNYQTQYTDYYNPQLNDQYTDATKKLTLQLARTGNLTGSTGAEQLAKLQQYYDTQKSSMTNQAIAAANTLRGNVDAKKSQLYQDNRASADPGNASSAAAAAAQYLQPTAPTTPLADMFTDFLNNYGNISALNNAQKLAGQSAGVGTYGSGGKSSYVVQ